MITIFSIDPATGKPYMELDVAQELIDRHIRIKSKNLFSHPILGIDDLTQEVLLRACASAYNPELSAPKTFLYLLAKSQLGTIKKATMVCGRDLVESDTRVFDDEDSLFATELFSDGSNPENILIAKEVGNKIYNESRHDFTTKKCKVCGLDKQLQFFTKSPRCKLGRTHRCKKCAHQSELKYKARKLASSR